MELKKNTGADLLRWRTPFRNLGLICSVSAVLVAFEWKAYDDKPLLEIDRTNSLWEEEQIPITVQTPPPPPDSPMKAQEIQVLDDDIVIEDLFELDINLSDAEPIPEIKLESPPIVDIADEILDFSEVPAQFQGGMEAWYRYLKERLTYPKQEMRIGMEGTVLLRFVVNTDGNIQDVTVIRSVSPNLDEAAMDAILNSPLWTPGLHHGRPVRTRMTIPIKFKLN